MKEGKLQNIKSSTFKIEEMYNEFTLHSTCTVLTQVDICVLKRYCLNNQLQVEGPFG